MSDMLALTQDLIARRSVTPDDAGCMELIASRDPVAIAIDWISVP